MRLRQLEYFVAICEAGSYTAAAARLYVSQPSLSQQIRALEQELDGQLLERTHHGVRLTQAGQVFLPEARAILSTVDNAVRLVRQQLQGLQGELSVLTVRSVAQGIVPATVTRWRTQIPEAVIRIRDHHHRRLVEAAMRAGEGDVAIGPRPPAWDGEVVSLGYEEMVVVSSTARLPDSRPHLTPAELDGQDWVMYEPVHGLNEITQALLERYDITVRPAAWSAQVEAALSLALQGVGYALVPENVVSLGWRSFTRRAADGVFRELTAYSHGEPSPLARRYIDMLRDVELPLRAAEELPPGGMLL